MLWHCFINIAFMFCVIYVTMKKETVTKSRRRSNKKLLSLKTIAKSIHSPYIKTKFNKIRFNITFTIWVRNALL